MSIHVAFTVQTNHLNRKEHTEALRADLQKLGFTAESVMTSVVNSLDAAQTGGTAAVAALLDEPEYALLRDHAAELFGDNRAIQMHPQ